MVFSRDLQLVVGNPFDIMITSGYLFGMDIKDLVLDPDRVRRIRRAAGMTQQQFAEHIGVAKVTVARWESGQRKCRNDFARRVLSIEGERVGSQWTTTVFDVDPKRIQALESGPAIEAIRDLLWSECRRLRIPTADVSIATIEVSDGGIDAALASLPEHPKSDSFFTAQGNHFQIKTGSSFKPWQKSLVRKELLGGDGKLGAAVSECLRNDGCYVLVSFGSDLTPQQRRKASGYIQDVFTEAGFSECRIEVWGLQELVGLFQRFPFLSLRLSGRREQQFQSWAGWDESREMRLDLALGDEQEQFRDKIRQLLREPGVSHIRITGEPGLGKTRLVHEALRVDDLKPLVVYVEHGEDFQKSQLFHELLHPDTDYYLILVIDECRPRDCHEIWDKLGHHVDRCRVISIDHESYSPDDPKFVEMPCPRLDKESIEVVIGSYIGNAVDCSRWAEYCSGIPRVAHAIGENLRKNPADLLKSLKMQHVWERFIAGYRDLNSEDSKHKIAVLRHIALFQRFGFEYPVEEEGQFVAGLVARSYPEITYPRFQEIVSELKRQRILQGKRTLFIAPKLLHVHLWSQFWENYGRGALDELIRNIPDSLTSWYVRMFSYASESQVALSQVERLLGPKGPFDDIRFASSDVGCRWLQELANAAPEKTLSCMERIVAQASMDVLWKSRGHMQQIVWALERIAVWPNLFGRVASLLRVLAESEDIVLPGNASGLFTNLFSLAPGRIAPTGATPEARLPILKETLDSVSTATRKLGVSACKKAMDIYSATRTIGPEYQGLKTAELWTPQTWEEVHTARMEVWSALFRKSRNWEVSLRMEANEALIDSAVGLIKSTTEPGTVIDTLELLVEDEATPLQKMLLMTTRFLKRSREKLDASVVDRLSGIDAKITGTHLPGRIRRFVLLSNAVELFADDGPQEESFLSRIDSLAREVADSPETLRDSLPELVRSSNRAAFTFGFQLAQYDRSNFLDEILAQYRREMESASPLFVGGYLATVFTVDETRWSEVVHSMISEDLFKDQIGFVICNSGITDEIVLHLLAQYDAGLLDTTCMTSFGYSQRWNNISEEVLLQVLERLWLGGEAHYALKILDSCYCADENKRLLPEAVTLEILRRYGEDDSDTDHCDYHWSVVAKQLANDYPARQTELFEIALAHIASNDWFLDQHSPCLEVIQPIVKADQVQSWKALTNQLEASTKMGRHRLLGWLGPPEVFDDEAGAGPLTLFNLEDVFEWIAEDPDTRAYALVQAVPRTLARDKHGVWARELLVRYGHQDEVRHGLLIHFLSRGWVGRASDCFRRKRDEARSWLESEKSIYVRQWLEAYINSLSSDIERAEIEEERRYDISRE